MQAQVNELNVTIFKFTNGKKNLNLLLGNHGIGGDKNNEIILPKANTLGKGSGLSVKEKSTVVCFEYGRNDHLCIPYKIINAKAKN